MRILTLDDLMNMTDAEWPKDEVVGYDLAIPRKGHATVFFSNGSSSTFSDETWPRGIAAICEEQGLPPLQHKPPIYQSDDSPVEAAPKPGMKCSKQQINKLVEQIRSGQPPKLPEGLGEGHYYDRTLPNFYIRLLASGVATWTVQWKKLGQQKKKAVGNVLTLDHRPAKEAAKDLLAKIQLNQLDPQEAKRERMRANKVTFETVAVPLFLEERVRKGELRPKTASERKRFFTGYYFQPLHSLPVDEITGEQIQARIDHIAIKSGNVAAIQCCAAMRGLFKWARKKYLPDGHPNPMTKVEPPKQNEPRERDLTNEEIQLIWKACEAREAKAVRDQQIIALGKGRKGLSHGGTPFSPDIPRAVMLLFLTGCRAQEIGDLQHSEVDLDNSELLIPKARIKNKTDLCNPLPDLAVQILRRIEKRPDRDSVFGNSNRSGLRLKGRAENVNEFIIQAGGTPPKNWTLHDIRRTFVTRMEALGVSEKVGEALVGHVGHTKKIRRTYNKYKYWAEKRRALAMWEANLRAIIDGTAERIAGPRFGEPRKENTA